MHGAKRVEHGVATREPSVKLLEPMLNAGGEIAIPDGTNHLSNPLIVGAWTHGGTRTLERR